jgi:hypothetical protein
VSPHPVPLLPRMASRALRPPLHRDHRAPSSRTSPSGLANNQTMALVDIGVEERRLRPHSSAFAYVFARILPGRQ